MIRQRLRISGQVQGVGFRPCVYRLAHELGLTGQVCNSASGVEVELQGRDDLIALFGQRLMAELPPLAEIDRIESKPADPIATEHGFVIAPSLDGAIEAVITPDAAICPACLSELVDSDNRRYRYPFINCTHCGPRYTITGALPYDRPQTSMAPFVQCPSCQSEYDAPSDRRFHAQPNACPDCGPQLTLLSSTGEVVDCNDPIAATLQRLLDGQILAVKGLGGFHLVCDARNNQAVANLRQRKQREEKPFAVMAANVASLQSLARIDSDSQAMMESPERPIVLLPKEAGCDDTLPGIAPGIEWLGGMLPYTPLHYLLFHEAACHPSNGDWLEQKNDLLLVMTSANPGGEPLVIDNDEALRRLGGIADAILVHDRDILIRCDDSVMRWNGEAPAFIRRARGFTPQAIKLPSAGPSVLACGPWFKNTICLTRGDEAFVSQHIGDLENGASCRSMEENVSHLMDVLQIQPEVVAHDLHPDFFSTQFAQSFAADHQLQTVAVQHHHAHIASVVAEHRHPGAVIGLALDGVGLGDDHSAWGGECLRVDGAQSSRLAHLNPLRLPGGDRAAREPWRMAVSALHTLGKEDEITRRYGQEQGGILLRMLDQGLNVPATTSAGRLFDAAAGLLGVTSHSAFEGQAAMLLEGMAQRVGAYSGDCSAYRIGSDNQLDLMPLLEQLTTWKDASEGAAMFHATLAEGLIKWACLHAEKEQLDTVVLAGGCFLNHILANSVRSGLQELGLNVLQASRLPCNDGGISLGQAWVAQQTNDYEVKA